VTTTGYFLVDNGAVMHGGRYSASSTISVRDAKRKPQNFCARSGAIRFEESRWVLGVLAVIPLSLVRDAARAILDVFG